MVSVLASSEWMLLQMAGSSHWKGAQKPLIGKNIPRGWVGFRRRVCLQRSQASELPGTCWAEDLS